jgi:pyruvate ferredoxin oxidoreductase gamma subunit
MLEVRFHGRGGQGAVTSAEIVAEAAIDLGKYAQSMPSFGPERRGAPVLAYLRVSDMPIRIRAEIKKPNIVVVLDDGLLTGVDVTAGLAKDGLLIINTRQDEDAIRQAIGYSGKLALVDALSIAMECLGVPITNTTMIGALIKVSGIIPIEAALKQVGHRFNAKLAEKNVNALKKASEVAKVFAPKEVKSAPKKAASAGQTWKEITVGALIDNPGDARSYNTGDWRSQKPEWDQSKCIKCGVCYMFCPEGAIKMNAEGYPEVDLFYCKGCGICAKECWTKCFKMVR